MMKSEGLSWNVGLVESNLFDELMSDIYYFSDIPIFYNS